MALTFQFDPVKIQYRNGTAAQWTSADPVLLQGEPGYEYDTGKFKIGDGVTAWSSLAYLGATVWRNGSGAPSSGLGANGDYYLNDDNGDVYLKSGGSYSVVANIAGPAATGTVTSVGLSLPAIFSVSGSPVTTSGTLTASLAVQNANKVWAGPTTGADAAPTFRAIVPADLPVFVASGASHAAGIVPDPGAVSGTTKFLREDATWAEPPGGGGGGSGTVTSVGLSLPTEITVSGSPVTTSGTLTGTWATQTTNKVFAAPNGSTGTPTFRALVSADIPDLSGTYKTARTGVVREVWIDAGMIVPRTTNGCAALATVEASTNKQNYDVLDFDAAASEYANFKFALPAAWNNGTVKAKFYWTAASGSGTVTWGLQALARADDAAIDAAWGTAQTVTDTLLATGDVHITAATAALTIAGSPAAGDLILWQVYRDVADTLGADARLLGVQIQYAESATEPSAW